MSGERVLKVVVFGLGGLIFALLGVVVWRIGTLPDDREDAAISSSGPFADHALDLAPGCRIAATTADSGRLIIRTTGPSRVCDGVYVFDLATGDRVGTIGP